MNLGTAFVQVRPDLRAFRTELSKQATEDAASVSKALGAALAGGAFLAGAKKATEVASRLEQAVGGTAAVFGAASKSIDTFAKGAAESAGLSERAARELTSSLGGLLKGFGFAADEAATLSVKLATLGADLAATFGGTPEEAVQALGAALRGETDPLERFGIALNQTLVNQKAVELGLAATTSAVDQNAKAQATLALIYERSADAAGQFGREADTAAGQAAIAAAKAENSAADLGENLLPIYTKIAEVVGITADAFGALPEPVQTAVIALAGIAALSGPVRSAASAISDLTAIARTQLTRAFDAGAVGAYNLSGALGTVAVGAGTLGVALFTAEKILGDYQREKAAAARIEDEYTRILSEQSGAVLENTRAFAGSELLKGELGEVLREAGLEIGTLTTGIEFSTEGIIALGDSLSGVGNLDNMGDLETALRNAGLEGTALADELIRLQEEGLAASDLDALIDRLAAQAEGYRNGAREAENKASADEAAGKAAGNAAGPVGGLTEELDLNEEAAKDAAESVDLFREAVEKALAPLDLEEAVDQRTQALQDIVAGIEERAVAVEEAQQRLRDLQAIPVDDRPEDFARQVADAQAEIRDALDQTSLTLEGNSEAALRNREDVRGLVDDAVAIIQANRDQGASLEDLQVIRSLERQGLVEQLEQMGFNRDEIARYIEAIDKIPLTKATTLTVDSAAAQLRIKELVESLEALGDNASFGIDGAVIDRNLQRASVQGFAAGGLVPDGLFQVHDGEVMRKDGASLEVIAGAPRALDGQVNNIVVNVLSVAASDADALVRAGKAISERVRTRA